MELQDLKSAWNSFSSRNENTHRLDEQTIREMLKKRTNDIVGKVDRNIRINFGMLLLLLIFWMFGSELAGGMPQGVQTPVWIVWLDRFNALVLGGTFTYFIIRYNTIRKSANLTNNLRDNLNRIIKTLVIYKVLFYSAMVLLLLTATIEFVSGLYGGIAISAQVPGADKVGLNSHQLFWGIVLGVSLLVIIVLMIVAIFTWGFKRLYGKYLTQLRETLRELDETMPDPPVNA